MRSPLSLPVPRSGLAVCVLLWVSAAYAVEKRDAAYQSALESIKAEDLGHYVGTLADTKLEGREAGSRGGFSAGNYVIEQFTREHLQPAGAHGEYAQPFAPNFRNILAVLPGSDPQWRDQYVVVGAHYDHVGYGGHGLSLGPYGYVHPGADDNASGTSAMIKLSEAFLLLPNSPKRSILFAAWDAEEKGLLGSKHWVAEPTVPLNHVVAMVNLDMIGRLRDDHLTMLGPRTGYGWRRLLSFQNDDVGLNLEFCWTLKAAADHFPFFDHGIPVIMAHTGVHDNYHRPSDVAALIDKPGLERVARFMFGVVYELADRPESTPKYRAAARRESPETEKAIFGHSGKPADRLGVGWVDDPAVVGGVRVSQVTAGSSAARAGLRRGDCITLWAGRPIATDDEFFAAVSSAESPVSLTIRREGTDSPLELRVDLDGTPLRWGFSWCLDDAEPGTIVLTHVVPGSPAAKAGMEIGDRVYQVGDRDFADEDAFVQTLKALPDSLSLLVERGGRLRNVTLQIRHAEPVKRAA